MSHNDLFLADDQISAYLNSPSFGNYDELNDDFLREYGGVEDYGMST